MTNQEFFENVKVVKKSNIYYDGKVTSRTIVTSDDKKKTLGIMLPGEYEFETGGKEIIHIYRGIISIKLPGGEKKTYKVGDEIAIPADTTFKAEVEELVDYCCSYE